MSWFYGGRRAKICTVSNNLERGKEMTYKVVEVQSKGKTREYSITGPSLESVESFWKWLVDNKTVESYTITREAV
jgi:hypothetical protein